MKKCKTTCACGKPVDIEKIEKEFQEALAAGQVPGIMGVSQWMEYGRKYGYWEYFEQLIEIRVVSEERAKWMEKLEKIGIMFANL